MMNRLEFISTLAGLPALARKMESVTPGRAANLPQDELFWEQVRQAFYLDEAHLDLRAFAVSPVPKATLSQVERDYSYIQRLPSLRGYEPAPGNQEALRVKIANELNCSPAEVALMRSTTEALNNALMGFQFKPGDEVLASGHEYDSMLGSLYQRQQREGIVSGSWRCPTNQRRRSR